MWVTKQVSLRKLRRRDKALTLECRSTTRWVRASSTAVRAALVCEARCADGRGSQSASELLLPRRPVIPCVVMIPRTWFRISTCNALGMWHVSESLISQCSCMTILPSAAGTPVLVLLRPFESRSVQEMDVLKMQRSFKRRALVFLVPYVAQRRRVCTDRRTAELCTTRQFDCERGGNA